MITPHTTPSAASPSAAAYGWYVVGLLTCAYLLAIVDRQILSLLVEPIKADLHMSDTQMGMLQGLAFGLFYTVAGMPLGYAADRFSRRFLLTGGVLGWSVMTAACGLAGGFGWLLAARVGVSVGEAALGPTAVPLIRDLVPKAQLARATGLYMLGIPLGSGIAILAGATILPALTHMGPQSWPFFGLPHPWQATFVVVAAPGVIVGLLMLTVRDPRSAKRRVDPQLHASVPLATVLAYARKHWRTFIGFGLPGIAATVMQFGVGFWIPSIFARSFGLNPGQTAGYLRVWGLLSLVLGVAGALTGGVLADRARRRREDGYVLMAAAGMLIMALSYGTFSFASSPKWMLIILAPAAFAGMIPPIMAAAAGVELAPAGMRSLIAAMWSPLFTLIGIGFGPAIIAATTSLVFHRESALREAIPLVVAFLAALALPLLLAVRAPYRATIADAEAIGRRSTPALFPF